MTETLDKPETSDDAATIGSRVEAIVRCDMRIITEMYEASIGVLYHARGLQEQKGLILNGIERLEKAISAWEQVITPN